MLFFRSRTNPALMHLETETVRRDRRLLGVYDLSVAPTSYDFLSFLTIVEMKRRREDYDRFDVVFVPALGNGFWDKEATSVDEKVWRVQNLLVPMCWLWPACASVSVLGTRGEAGRLLRRAGRDVYPDGYRLDKPVLESFQLSHVIAARACGELLPRWEAPRRARELIDGWLAPRAQGRRVVTITLREASYYQARNSNLALWIEFARQLDEEGYFVVFLRDTELAFEPVADAQGSFEIFPPASISLAMRAALYEASFALMMPSQGPLNLLFLHPECHGVICDLLNRGAANSTPTVLRSLGLEIGQQAPLLGATKRFVWEPTTVRNLRYAFDELVALIESSPEHLAARAFDEAEPALRLARRLRETGRYEPSRRIYQHELAKVPHAPAPLCGISLTILDSPRPAFRHWRRVSRRLVAYWRMAKAATYFLHAWLAGLSRWTEVDEGIEIALCLESWGRRNAAAAIYRAILDLNAEEPTALYRLALYARDRGDATDAISKLQRAIAIDPHAGRPHLALAELLAARGEADAAQRHCTSAAACDASLGSELRQL
jgi:tetratricopeptide (TPR) repeat protein